MEAVQWYGRTAKRDHPEAQYSLRRAYENGSGVAKDHSEAAEGTGRLRSRMSLTISTASVIFIVGGTE